MKPLYEMTADYRQALAALSDADMPQEAIDDTLEGLVGEIEDKAVAVAAMVLNLEAEAAQIKEAKQRMEARFKSATAKAQSLRDYLSRGMQAADLSEVKTPEFAVKIKATPPAVQIAEGALIPPDYLRPPAAPAPDKTKLKAAIKAGATIDGVSLVSGYRVEIK